jgi:AAA+ ATPase superfamily predicted ATPase
LGLSDKLPFLPTQIGRWWRASEEIDLIALGEYQAILVECKWTNKPVGLDVLRNLEHKLPYVQPDLEKRKVAYAICALLYVSVDLFFCVCSFGRGT